MAWIGFIPSTTSSDGDITGVTAGTGMTGGGTTGAVTLNLVGGDGITANANDMAITAAQTTITSVLNTSLVIGRDADNDIDFATDNQIIFRVGGGDNVIFKASGEIEATSLDISGDVDIDGTMEADAITLGGVTVLAAVDEDNMASDSNTLVPTQQSVKAYVDANAGGSVSGNTFATDLKIGRDADNLVDFTTDNEITFRVSAGDGVVFKASGEIEATKFDGALEGNADTATALATTRALQVTLSETDSSNFDGTAAVTDIGVTGTLAVGNGGTGVTSMTNLKNALDDETWTFANNVTLAGFVLDGNTITGVDDSGEFTNDDAHIMTSAGIEDKILGYSYITASSSDTLSNKTIAISQVTELSNLTADEGAQLENIGTTTISAAQWGYLGAASGAITNSDTVDMGDGFVIEDDDGTEVTITENKEVKFIGSGITTNWTDTDNGTDGDPYDLTFTVDAAQTGITSVLNASLAVGRDAHNQIDFSTDNEIHFKTNNETPVIKMKASGEIEATKFDGALEGNADTATLATNATHVTVTDNENTNEENLIPFIEDASATGNVGLESDGDFAYNPSTGTVSATIFKGNIDAVDGDFDGTLEVDNLTIGGAQGSDGQVLTSTGSGVAWEDAAGGGSVSGNTFATDLKIGRDADNLIDFTTDNQVTFRVSANDGVVMKASGEIEATSLDISGASAFDGNITLPSDTQIHFGHTTNMIEGASSGEYLMLFGKSGIFFRTGLTTRAFLDGNNFEFSVPAIPATSDGVALGSTSKMWSDLFLASGGVVNFNNGDVTVTHSSNTLTVGGGNLDTNRQLNKTSSTDFEAKGDIVYIGSGATTQGELCYLTSGGAWAAADADATGTSGGVLLALALGTDPDADGMLLRGMFTLDHDPGTIADELYVSTTAGDITGTAPSGSGDIVRVIGYCLDCTNGQIWFNPSNDFIVLA